MQAPLRERRHHGIPGPHDEIAGDKDRDGAIENCARRVSKVPPAEMPNPVTVRIALRG